jgi:uncharacterized damage-inducible protein DinB
MENYFNYFTEIEEHFQRVRGSGMFLLSSLDWALIETWKEAEIPLDAVLRGIDRSFEKAVKRKRSSPRKVNSLAYCTQEVLAAVAEKTAPAERKAEAGEQPFAPRELAKHFAKCAAKYRERFPDTARSLEDLDQAAESSTLGDLEEVERRLTAMEEKVFAGLMVAATEDELVQTRGEMDRQLASHRRKMPAAHLAMVEKQFIQKKLLERAGLPRLSLFYL